MKNLPLVPNKAKRKVYFVGVGPMGTQQMTLETIVLLRSCDRVFITAFLENHKFTWEDLHALKSLGIPLDVETKLSSPLEKTASQILAASKDSASIGIICQGNPALFGHAYSLHVPFAAAGYECVHFSALSSFDCVLTALQSLGVLNAGLGFQLYFAQDMDPKQLLVNPNMATLLYRFELLKNLARPRFERLMRQIVSIYPADHRVVVVRCEPGGERCYFIDIGRLGRYDGFKEKDRFFNDGNITVYIPPLSQPLGESGCWDPERRLDEIETVRRARIDGSSGNLVRRSIGTKSFKKIWGKLQIKLKNKAAIKWLPKGS